MVILDNFVDIKTISTSSTVVHDFIFYISQVFEKNIMSVKNAPDKIEILLDTMHLQKLYRTDELMDRLVMHLIAT